MFSRQRCRGRSDSLCNQSAVRRSGALFEVSVGLGDGLSFQSLEMTPSEVEVGAGLFVGLEAGAPMVVAESAS